MPVYLVLDSQQFCSTGSPNDSWNLLRGPDHLSSCPNKQRAEARSGPVFAPGERGGE